MWHVKLEMRLERVEASVERALSHKLRILAFGAMGGTSKSRIVLMSGEGNFKESKGH